MSDLPKINMNEGWQDLSICPTEGILEFLQIDKDGKKYLEVADIKNDTIYYNDHTKWRPLTELMRKALLNVRKTLNTPTSGKA